MNNTTLCRDVTHNIIQSLCIICIDRESNPSLPRNFIQSLCIIYTNYSIKFWFLSKSSFKNGGSRCCVGAESKEKKYLVKFTNQADKWSTQYPFLKQVTRGETYALCKTCNTDFSIGHGGDNEN